MKLKSLQLISRDKNIIMSRHSVSPTVLSCPAHYQREHQGNKKTHLLFLLQAVLQSQDHRPVLLHTSVGDLQLLCQLAVLLLCGTEVTFDLYQLLL